VCGCCGMAEGHAVAVLSCAGAYVSGYDGSNECPVFSVRIEAEAACRTAVTAAGKTPGSNFVMTNYGGGPWGCYFNNMNNDAYFNAHAAGSGYSGRSNRMLLCAAVTGARVRNR
jgi:hypothetical protein